MSDIILQDLLKHELTASIFAFMMKKQEPVGVREVQNELNIPSSATAYWHLNKMKEKDVLEQLPDKSYRIREEYQSVKEIPLSLVIDHYVFWGMLLPKYLVVQIFSILMLVSLMVTLLLREWIIGSFMGLLSIIVINFLLAYNYFTIYRRNKHELEDI